MTPPSDDRPRFKWITASGVLVLATCAASVILWFGLPAMGATSQQLDATVAVLTCGGFALLSLLPVIIMDRKTPAGAAYGFMIGMLVRLIGCGALALAGDKLGMGERFVLWMAGAYLYVLMIELILISRHVKRIQLPKKNESAQIPTEGKTA